MKLLIINLGSTSSKIAVYEDENELFVKTVDHDASSLADFKTNLDQLEFRKNIILKGVSEAGFQMAEIDAICSRGGTLKPVKSGTYKINRAAVKDASAPELGGRHASTIGVLIADSLSAQYGIPAYFVDPVSTDELIDEARYTGFKGMERISMFHALNQKSAARRAADILGRSYEELNLIGVHMGGGVSVAAHRKGQVIDTYNVRDDGCFSMDRGGNLPTTDIVNLCFTGLTKQEVKKLFGSQAGVFSYLGTRDFREVETRVKNGDEEAEKVFKAMVYQHVKCIGAMAATMKFVVDGIFLTAGIAYSRMMCDAIKEYVEHLAPVIEIPGENEMRSLAEGALRVLRGDKAKEY